jgi:hypothetical protein
MTLAGGLPLPPSTLPVINPALQNGTSPYYWDPNSGFEPYVQQATLGIQRYLAAGFFVSATYVGQKGNHLQGNQDYLNQLPVADLAMGTLLTQPYNSATAVAAGIKAPYAGFSGSVAQAIRPFPQYLNILNRFDGSGKNRYDALQVQVRKQIGDLQVAVNFTGSKNLSDTRPGEFSGSPGAALDTHNLRLEKAVANNDASRVLTGTWLYELPAGKGKRFAGGAHGVLNQVVSGWQVGAIQTYRNGLIRGVTGGVPLPIFSITTRPDMIQGAHVQLQNCSNLNLGVSVIANINAFTANGPFQLGTAPRNLPAYRGCAWMDEDFTLQKRVALRESVHLEFRGEFYNIFNRHKFADPALNFNSPGSFGKITGIDGQFQPRIVQVGMKLIF